MTVNSTTLSSQDSEAIGDVCSTTAAPPFYWLLTLIIGALAMIGNGLVIFVYIWKKVERNATNLIITNLAVVDFFSGLSLIITFSLPRLPKPEGDGLLAQIFCRVYCSGYFIWSLLNSSVFNLLLVTSDRYLSVVAPFFHKNKFSTPVVLRSCVGMTWMTGLIIAGYNLLINNLDGEVCAIDFSMASWLFVWSGYWSFFGMLIVPSLLMVLAYAHISYKLAKMPENSQGRKLQKKVTISCFAVLAIFFICWFPDQLYFYLFSLNLPSLNITLGNWVYHLVVNLGFANCCLNPFLYAFLNPNYKRVFKNMFGFGDGGSTKEITVSASAAKTEATKL